MLVSVLWVFPKTIKEALLGLRGSLVGKKRRKIWNSVPPMYFLDSLEGKKLYSIKRRDVSCTKVKEFFFL